MHVYSSHSGRHRHVLDCQVHDMSPDIPFCWRAQPPVCNRLWLKSKGHFALTEPLGGASKLGFSSSKGCPGRTGSAVPPELCLEDDVRVRVPELVVRIVARVRDGGRRRRGSVPSGAPWAVECLPHKSDGRSLPASLFVARAMF